MRTLVSLICIMLVAAGGASAPLTSAEAAKPTDRLIVPLIGTVDSGTFTGSFSITSFELRGNQIFAVGIVSGAATGPLGRSGITGPVAMQVTVTNQASATRGAVVAQQEGCEIHLSFEGLNLDFLGLAVTLSPVTIDLVPGAGPVGNIVTQLCNALTAVGNVLGLVTNLLNTLLSVLGGVVGGIGGI